MNRVALLAAATLTAAAALICVPQAEAAPLSTVTVAASATGPTGGAADATKAVITATITVSDAPADDATLTADEVPGRVTAVDVDNSPAPAGTYDTTVSTNPEQTRTFVRLGDGANATVPGTLSVGKHTVAITTDLSNRSDGPLRVTVTAGFINGQAPAPSATATIPLPDLSIATSKYNVGRNGLSIAPGGESFFLAEVRNRGPKVQASTLTITLPDGVGVSSDEGVVRYDDSSDGETDLNCTKASATELRCPFGAVSGEVDVEVDLEASAAAKPGSRGTLAIHIEADDGLDATPADNTTSTAVRVVPPARLRTSLTTDDASVEVGSKGRLTATVTNEGTEPVSVVGIVAVTNDLEDKPDDTDKQHFEITAFSGREGIPDVGGGDEGNSSPVPAAGAMPALVALGDGAGDVKAMARHAAAADDDDSDIDANLRFWNIGTLAPGATIKAVATVRAKSLGRSEAVAVANATNGASSCLQKAVDDEADVLRCPEIDTVKLRAVAGAGTNGNGTLAATGVPTTQLTVLGLALLLLGGLSLYAGSPRSRVIGRHRT